MQFKEKELINLIKSCMNLEEKVVKNIINTVVIKNNIIEFKINPAYYVLPTTSDLLLVNIIITTENYKEEIMEALIMSPITQEIIEPNKLFYYISIPKIKEKNKLTDWEKRIINN